jgi:hypothetical protein
MTKESGLGDRLYVGGYDLSGDVNSPSLSGGPAPLVVTGIDKGATERIGGVRDGNMGWTAFFNTAVGQAHPVLSALPTADVHVAYLHTTLLGAPAATIVAKQIGYDGSRADDGAFTFALQAQANGFGLEWGQQLTPGLRTDTAATNGASLDQGAATAFGAQAYLQVAALTGTDVTVKIQDSADNVTFADVTGLTFAATTTARTAQRIAVGGTQAVRRYVRAVTTTSGGFTSASFIVIVNINTVAVSF